MVRQVKREFVDLETITDERMADIPGIVPSSSVESTIPSDDAEMTDYNASQTTGT